MCETEINSEIQDYNVDFLKYPGKIGFLNNIFLIYLYSQNHFIYYSFEKTFLKSISVLER